MEKRSKKDSADAVKRTQAIAGFEDGGRRAGAEERQQSLQTIEGKKTEFSLTSSETNAALPAR